MRIVQLLVFAVLVVMSASRVSAQTMPDSIVGHENDSSKVIAPTLMLTSNGAVSNRDAVGTLLIDRADFDSLLTVASHMRAPLPKGYFAPPVFSSVAYLDTLSLRPVERDENFATVYTWIDDAQWHSNMMRHTKQHYMVAYPELVAFNIRTLPVPPKNFRAFVDPVSTMIVLEEEPMKTEKNPDGLNLNIAPKHWISDFTASLQFSQAYISPNWYQGGTRNLNMIAQAIYNVKLNQKLHPKLMFEATVQYKLGMNSAPDDTVRSYNISEDLFQANAKFGLKAHKRWYYSSNLSFKTQLFNSYPSNSRELRAAFLSPGELNVGVGMTYNFENLKKTVAFNASISPVSWNLRTCTNKRLDPASMNIDNGHRSINEVGSNVEVTFNWKIAYNIRYSTRLFTFTDYEYIQGDWEHTLAFDVTRFLSTQIYCHLRYDSNTPPCDDPGWKKFQFKEIFSLGFNYKFSSI
ncbi:MAG: DUF3078 domain-containing protein [Paramuribaculum sp.]|nr:DUF3078 domain-containing protein [Paramuribaculum sp.]